MHRRDHQGLVYYQFDELCGDDCLAHGVFTRLGGVSQSPYESLNVGATVGDDITKVSVNRQRLAEALGFAERDCRTTWQVHGADVIVLRGREPQSSPPPQADAIVTAERNLPIVMRFADCVPLLLYDPQRRAIGMAHAGWRGTVAGVGPATVRTMVAAFGCHPYDIVAGIGPSIGPCCYEVGAEVVDQVAAAFGDTEGLIKPWADDGHNLHFDLWEANARSLRQIGVGRIETAGLCTADMVGEFFSHRAEKGKTGRFGAALMLREGAHL